MTRRAQTTLSSLQAPVDALLGTASHVRILRVLTEFEHPIPPVELARETRLDLSGVLRAIKRLAESGIVRTIGVGGGRVIQFNTTHYFAPVVQQLFDAERKRCQELFDALQQAVLSVVPTPRAAWIEGPHALGQDTGRDALRVAVLVHVRDRETTANVLTERLRAIERTFGLTVDLVLRTMADLMTLTPEQLEALHHVRLIYGVPPIHLVDENGSLAGGDGNDRAEQREARTHSQLDLEIRRSAERIVREIERDPRVVERAKRWVAHRLGQASESERHELREWAHILTMPAHRIGAFLRDPGERATRLRQTSPFIVRTDAVERDRST